MLKVSFRHYGESVLEIPLPCHSRVAIPKELEETAKVHLISEGEVVDKRRLWSTDSSFQLRMKQCREVVEGTFISETLVDLRMDLLFVSPTCDELVMESCLPEVVSTRVVEFDPKKVDVFVPRTLDWRTKWEVFFLESGVYLGKRDADTDEVFMTDPIQWKWRASTTTNEEVDKVVAVVRRYGDVLRSEMGQGGQTHIGICRKMATEVLYEHILFIDSNPNFDGELCVRWDVVRRVLAEPEY